MTPEDVRRLLGQNAAHTARAVKHGEVVRSAAAEALDGARSRLSAISPAEALLDEGKASEYRRLVGEAGRLSVLLGSPTAGGESGGTGRA